MLSQSVNVAIVDDHTLFRKTLKNYLSEQKNINVVIQSPDIPDLLNRLQEARVQVLLLDVFMPKLNGIEAVKVLRQNYPDTKILVLSMCTDMDLLCEMLELGVYGILSKSDEPEELLNAIKSLSEHRIYRNKLFTEVMYWNKQIAIKTQPETRAISLNIREKEILQLLWEEKSNKEIANHLFLSVRSVEKIRQDMKEKLGLKSTIGLLKYAINKKIIITSPREVRSI
ncbi:MULTISPECIES: response regulator transcription factor [Niastella]|uniref:Response regulator transcription factor n=1 Tax=Niastella soli TaxID=2821487 RepID=A0ABS3Z5T2_9BACT|nr:response regulator transcription factor [Niastella soli]MBO9205524.1 response regulator transcription factor [Niastella soli]